MPDTPIDSLAVVAQGCAAILTVAGSFLLGRYQARTRASVVADKAAAGQRTDEHREREQLFNHYNELIQVTREMNHALRNELSVVQTQMHGMQLDHAKLLSDAAREREECRVENERLKSELRHLKSDLAEVKKNLADYHAAQTQG